MHDGAYCAFESPRQDRHCCDCVHVSRPLSLACRPPRPPVRSESLGRLGTAQATSSRAGRCACPRLPLRPSPLFWWLCVALPLAHRTFLHTALSSISLTPSCLPQLAAPFCPGHRLILQPSTPSTPPRPRRPHHRLYHPPQLCYTPVFWKHTFSLLYDELERRGYTPEGVVAAVAGGGGGGGDGEGGLGSGAAGEDEERARATAEGESFSR